MGFWYVKIETSQNMDQNISFERPYKELLNALISFEIFLLPTQVMGSQKRDSK